MTEAICLEEQVERTCAFDATHKISVPRYIFENNPIDGNLEGIRNEFRGTTLNNGVYVSSGQSLYCDKSCFNLFCED